MKTVEYFFPNWPKDKKKLGDKTIVFIESIFLEKIIYFNKNNKKYKLLKLSSKSIFWTMHALSILSIIITGTFNLNNNSGLDETSIMGITLGVLQVLAWPAYISGFYFRKMWKLNYTSFESLKLAYHKLNNGTLENKPEEFIMECEIIIKNYNEKIHNKKKG